MLKSLFTWLDQHPNAYWMLAAGPTFLLLGRIISLIRQDEAPGTATAASRMSVWQDAALLFLFLLAWRWPFLLAAGDFNPDESQLIAGAITLTYDPVFWRSVDGTTSGPLNFYALLPLHWLGLPLDYFSARLTGLLLIAGALWFCHRTLTRLFDRTSAWLGVLPVLIFFATVTNTDLIHYSSEHLSLLLMAGTIALLAGRKPGDLIRLAAACFLAGCLPLGKLQTAPLFLVLLGWGLWQSRSEAGWITWLRRGAVAVGAAGLPLMLIMLMVLGTGQVEAAVRRYFLNNLHYVDSAPTMAESLRELSRSAKGESMLFPMLAVIVATLLVSLLVQLARRTKPPALLAIAGWLTLTAVGAILAPRRGFLHYILLLPIPVTVLLGATIGGWWPRLPSLRLRWGCALGLVGLLGTLPLALRVLRPAPDPIGNFSYEWRHPRTSAAVVVKALTGPHDSLAIWGWANRLYVETGLPQATRDAHSVWSIVPGAQQDYHRSVYLADLRRHQPAVFVDAVGPGAFTFDDRLAQGHEIFPELADYIRVNYVFVHDLGEARIYARNDLAALAGLNSGRLDELISQGRLKSHGFLGVPPVAASSQRYPSKVVGQEIAMMLLPPARVEWALSDDVRAITLTFGFDPVAVLQGVSDGAEIILELAREGNTRPLLHRRLDPVRQHLDRGNQTAEIVLPPFGPGSHLVLRTEAGPDGNNAWDWTYLAGLKYHRSPSYLPEQFPGFNRVPDSAQAEGSSYVRNGRDSQLFLHAPASLTYQLGGGERRMQFTYGFLPGAYSDGGRTDGAVFRVQLMQPGKEDRAIFERFLQPGTKPGDRGPQLEMLNLPQISPGDRLLVSIDAGPGGNAAWDWTYIHRFTLE
jgi:hypothetical protein